MTFFRWSCSSRQRLRGCGTDAEQVSRFARVAVEHPCPLPFVFSAREIYYCRSVADPAVALCASFCCKEAFFKALGEPYPFPSCEFFYEEHASVHRIRLGRDLRRDCGIHRVQAQVLSRGTSSASRQIAVTLFVY